MNIYLINRIDRVSESQFVMMVVMAPDAKTAISMHPDGGTLKKYIDGTSRKKSNWPKDAKYLNCEMLGVANPDMPMGVYCSDYAELG